MTGAGGVARVRLAALPTPLVPAPRLAEVVGAGALYVKRDDLTGFAFAGNKARPLEFLLAAALEEGADTLVTGGAPGSNFCAAAAAAAARAGLRCELVIAGNPAPGPASGWAGFGPGPALALARSWGAAVRWTGVAERDSVDAGLPAAAAELAAAGHRPYLMPRGGASGLGAVGYALAAFELREQLAACGVDSARVVVAAGSGGTLAGLVAGNVLAGRPLTLVGAAVSRPADETARRVLALARECLRVLAGSGLRGRRSGSGAGVGPDDVVVADARGPGHGLASPEGTAAAEQAMRTEGLMVDPVYTAKALALVGRYAGGGNVVFWHTGGQLDVVALGTEPVTTTSRPAAGPPMGPPAAELIEAGFELENADAPVLHHGMNLADLAHLLDLASAGVIPPEAARQLLALLLEVMQIPARDFPYDPANGEPYNSRERYFVSRVGDVAGWLHAGRPRREAVRVAFRLRLRSDLTDLIEAAAALAAELASRAREHAGTLMADQTYLQHAQPSTFGHYVLSFAFPVLRGGRRLNEALAWTDASPGGAGCVNGTRLRADRRHVAALLGFRTVAEHTRDAMWQVDGLFDMVSAAAGLVLTQSKLAEDLEIWASQEFDYVTLADGYSRASVLMPQKRNPYALSIVRGAAGTLIGRLTGLLAVAKTPSARSDNLIFAYGEVPRALDLALRTTRLTTGVVRTLEVNAARMRAALESGFSQATDLAEYVMQTCGIDYRSAYRVVGHAVRQASAAGLRGSDIDGALLDASATEVIGRPLGLTGHDLSAALDPWQIVVSRTTLGGAAPGEVTRMAEQVTAQADELAGEARRWRETYRAAEDALVAAARRGAAGLPPDPRRSARLRTRGFAERSVR